MTDERFKAACDELAITLFPGEDRNGAVGGVLVDADILRELLARLGGRILFRQAALNKAVEDAYGRAQLAIKEERGAARAFEQGVYMGLRKAVEILQS